MKAKTFLLRHGPGLFVSLLAAVGVFNSVMNNAYQYGSTFFDSAEFATVIWRSGLTLEMGPAFAGNIYPTHASTINYIPALFSYLWWGDRMNYYGFVYALLYFATVYTAYAIMLPMLAGRCAPWLAALGAALLFCGQILFDGAWEMRSDFFAGLFLPLAFLDWQKRRYQWALLWFALGNMVREDIGIMVIVPIALLAGLQWWAARRSDVALARERLVWGIRTGALCLVWALATIYIQKHYFPVYDLLQDQYYDRANPFGHLSRALIDERLAYHWQYARGIWMPLAVVGIAAVALRDMQMMVGFVAFMPYIVGMFFSKSDMSAQLSSYKPFMLPVCLLWPALLAYGRPEAMRRRYMIVQAAVLVCGMFYLRPGFIEHRYRRWFPQPLTANAQLYRDFGEKQLKEEIDPAQGATRASHSVLALYPYSFIEYWHSWIVPMKPEDAAKVKTLIWFENDRDQPLIDNVLKSGEFDIRFVEGTKIRIAHRRGAMRR